jgi:myosin-crossreactive antigen
VVALKFTPHTEYDELQKTISVYFRDGDFQFEKISEKIDLLVDQEGSIIGCRLHVAGEFQKIVLDDFK